MRMALVTPADWLPVLTLRLDQAQPDVDRLRSYVNGNAPMPEMGKNTRATWLAFQRKARTNFGGIACQSHANRITLRGIRVGADVESAAAVAARRIARDNRLPMVIADAVWDMLSARRGYLVAGDDAGSALITSEKPESFYAEQDPVRPWRSRAAIKVWRDPVEMIDYAKVWVPGARQTFARRSSSTTGDATVVLSVTSGGGWAAGAVEIYSGGVPVWIFDRRDGLGLIEPHLDVIDRINLGKLQRLSIAAMQAFRQRALKKSAGAELPLKDANDNPIDYQKVFEPAPGALWDLPEGIDIWESSPSDIRQLLDGEKADERTFAAVSGTPVSMLTPDSANQSATGASATTAQQVDACRSDIERIRLAIVSAILTALRIEGVPFGDDTIEVDFLDPAWVTLSEQMDAVSKGVAAGVSLEMAQKMFLGWSQEQIAEDTEHRRRAQSRASIQALTQSQPAPAMAGPPMTPPAMAPNAVTG